MRVLPQHFAAHAATTPPAQLLSLGEGVVEARLGSISGWVTAACAQLLANVVMVTYAVVARRTADTLLLVLALLADVSVEMHCLRDVHSLEK